MGGGAGEAAGSPAAGAGGGGGGPLISEEQWEAFEEEGFVVLGRCAPEAQIARLQERIDDVMMGRAETDCSKLMMQLDGQAKDRDGVTGAQTLGHKGATLSYRKIQNLDQDALFRKYMELPVFREACARVYGDGVPIRVQRAMFMNKPSETGGTVLPWHQDRWPYLSIDPLLTVYTALDEATPESGCVQLVPGSHKLGVVNREHKSSFLTAQQGEEICGEGRVVDLVLRPGDVALLHNWTIHRSGTNSSGKPRRAFSVNFCDGRTVVDVDMYRELGYSEGGDELVRVF